MARYSRDVPIGIGDVLVTREGSWFVSTFIRLGAWLTGRPAHCNHAIVVHHQDEQGILWGLEGKPGGVGWRDLTGPLSWKLTNANNEQPKTEEQRYLIAVASESLLSTPYDWDTILDHVKVALRLWSPDGPVEWEDDEVPAHVVCSAFADWAYEQVGLKNPGGNTVTRMTTPGDWDAFMMRKEWENGA